VLVKIKNDVFVILSSCGHQYLHFKESDKTLFKQKFYHDLPCEIISVKVCSFSDLCKEVLKSYYLFLVCSGTIPSTAPGANSGFFQRGGGLPQPFPLDPPLPHSLSPSTHPYPPISSLNRAKKDTCAWRGWAPVSQCFCEKRERKKVNINAIFHQILVCTI